MVKGLLSLCLALLVAAPAWGDVLTLHNVNAIRGGQAHVSFFDSTGTQTLLHGPIPLNQSGAARIDLDELNELPAGRYSAVVNADWFVAASAEMHNPDQTVDGWSAYIALLTGQTTGYLPLVTAGPPPYVGDQVVIQNIGDGPASLTTGFYNPDGSQAGPIFPGDPPPNGWQAIDLSTDPSGLPPGFSGVGGVWSDQPVVLVDQGCDGTGCRSYGGWPPDPAGSQVFLPQVFDSACGPQSTIVVKNITGASTGATVYYFDQAGVQVQTQSADFNGGLQTSFIPPPGTFGNNCWGSAVVEGSGLGVVVDQFLPGGGRAAYNGLPGGDGGLSAPGVVYQTDGFQSQVVIQNAGDGPASVDCEYFGDDGRRAFSKIIDLHAKASAKLEPGVDMPGAEFSGSVYVYSDDVPLAAVVNQVDPASGQVRMSYGAQSGAATEVYLPLIVKR